jgi:hypothetical protein
MILTNDIYQQIRTIIVYSFILIIILGIVFNTLAFIVFSRKRFKRTVFATYFRFLIITDTLSLLMPLNKILEINYNIYIEKISNTLCKLRMYVPYVISPISAWILVIISLDRWMSIVISNKFLIRKKSGFQILICILIIGFNLIFYTPSLSFGLEEIKFIDNLTNESSKMYSCSSNLTLLSWMDAFQGCFLPFSLMISFSCLTIIFIFNTRKKTIISTTNNNNKQSSIKKRDIRFAIVSVSVNVIFLILNSPFTLVNLLDDSTMDQTIYDFLLSIRLFLYYFNFCLVFFINLGVNSTFRDEFLNMISKKDTSSLN